MQECKTVRFTIASSIAVGLILAIVLVASNSTSSSPHPSWLEAKSPANVHAHGEVKAKAQRHIKALHAKKTQLSQHWTHKDLSAVKKGVDEALADKETDSSAKAEAKLTFAKLEAKAHAALSNGHAGAAHEVAIAMRLKAAADAKISSQTAEEATRDSKASDKIERQVDRIRREREKAAKQAHTDHAAKRATAHSPPEGDRKKPLETYVKEQAELAHYEYELAHDEGDGRRRTKPQGRDSTDALVGDLSKFLHAAKAEGFSTGGQ